MYWQRSTANNLPDALRCRDRHDRFVTELLAGKSFIYQVRPGGRLAAVTAGLARTTFG
jgi:hypothetical protein